MRSSNAFKCQFLWSGHGSHCLEYTRLTDVQINVLSISPKGDSENGDPILWFLLLYSRVVCSQHGYICFVICNESLGLALVITDGEAKVEQLLHLTALNSGPPVKASPQAKAVYVSSRWSKADIVRESDACSTLISSDIVHESDVCSREFLSEVD